MTTFGDQVFQFGGTPVGVGGSSTDMAIARGTGKFGAALEARYKLKKS